MRRRDFGLTMLATPLLAKTPKKLRVYVGTYTRKGSKGIYQFEMDLATGALKPMGVAAETENPSFLALHPKGNLMYSVGELSDFSIAQKCPRSARIANPLSQPVRDAR